MTKTALAAGSVSDLQAGYATHGWRADDAVLSALACADKAADIEAVTTAVRAIYLPWLEESARYLQMLVAGFNTPVERSPTPRPLPPQRANAFCSLMACALMRLADSRLPWRRVAARLLKP